MPIAAAVAYCKITETRSYLSEGGLSEMVHLTAIALSTVAPIYIASGDGAGVSVLSLRVRKADLERGIETLKASNNASGKSTDRGALASLRLY